MDVHSVSNHGTSRHASAGSATCRLICRRPVTSCCQTALPCAVTYAASAVCGGAYTCSVSGAPRRQREKSRQWCSVHGATATRSLQSRPARGAARAVAVQRVQARTSSADSQRKGPPPRFENWESPCTKRRRWRLLSATTWALVANNATRQRHSHPVSMRDTRALTCSQSISQAACCVRQASCCGTYAWYRIVDMGLRGREKLIV